MSTRAEKLKRVRPKNEPYKRSQEHLAGYLSEEEEAILAIDRVDEFSPFFEGKEKDTLLDEWYQYSSHSPEVTGETEEAEDKSNGNEQV